MASSSNTTQCDSTTKVGWLKRKVRCIMKPGHLGWHRDNCGHEWE